MKKMLLLFLIFCLLPLYSFAEEVTIEESSDMIESERYIVYTNGNTDGYCFMETDEMVVYFESHWFKEKNRGTACKPTFKYGFYEKNNKKLTISISGEKDPIIGVIFPDDPDMIIIDGKEYELRTEPFYSDEIASDYTWREVDYMMHLVDYEEPTYVYDADELMESGHMEYLYQESINMESLPFPEDYCDSIQNGLILAELDTVDYIDGVFMKKDSCFASAFCSIDDEQYCVVSYYAYAKEKWIPALVFHVKNAVVLWATEDYGIYIKIKEESNFTAQYIEAYYKNISKTTYKELYGK